MDPAALGVDLVSAIERVPVAADAARTVAALEAVLRAREMTVYAVVDHGHDMAAAGTEGISAWTLVFGNPAAGAKVLLADIESAIDLPLRLAVVAAGPTASVIVLRVMDSLLSGPAAALADGLTSVLRSVAAQGQALAAEG